MKILVLDDSKTTLMVFESFLLRLGHEVTLCGNGQSALETFQQNEFHVVIMDIIMPDMDGFEFCRRLRTLPSGDLVLIIAITSFNTPEVLQSILDAGADDYLPKPFDNSLFSKLLKIRLTVAEKHIDNRFRRAQVENELRENEEKYRLLVENMDDLVCELDLTGQFLYLNPQYQRVLGYTPLELMQTRPENLIHPDDYGLAQQQFTKLLQNKSQSRNEWRFKHKNGEWRWFECVANLYETLAGELRIVVISRDVTKRKFAEDKLQKQKAFFKKVIDANPNLIFVKDKNGKYILANTALADAYGTTVEALIGRVDTEHHVHTEEAEKFMADDQEVMTTRQPKLIPEESLTHAKTGLIHTLRTIKIPLLDENEDPCVLGVATDITELKQLTEELMRSNRELEQFAYIASHDLREPLRKIKSFTELLAQRYHHQLDEKADKYIDYVVDGAARMQTMIEGLLMYSRVGRNELEVTPVDFEMIVQQVISDLELKIHENHAVITYDSLPLLSADMPLIKLVFQNLIDNALKYRREEPPRIHISANQNNQQWVFSIEDNGIGIESQYAERIFKVFQRLHSRNEYLGTGIGLSISQKIIERHGGWMWFSSVLGEGTTFYFVLPIKGVS